MYCASRFYSNGRSCIKRATPIDTASWFDGAFGADSGYSAIKKIDVPAPVIQALTVLFLVSVFAQALLTLVGSNFVTFAFFSARHTIRVMSEKLLLIGWKFWVGQVAVQLKISKP